MSAGFGAEKTAFEGPSGLVEGPKNGLRIGLVEGWLRVVLVSEAPSDRGAARVRSASPRSRQAGLPTHPLYLDEKAELPPYKPGGWLPNPSLVSYAGVAAVQAWRLDDLTAA